MMRVGNSPLSVAATYVFLAIAAFSVLFPLALMLIASVRTNFDIFTNPLAFPDVWHWENYVQAWRGSDLGPAMLNSLTVTSVTTVLTAGGAAMAGWVIARRRVRWWGAISVYFLATTTIPVQLFLFPLYFLFARLGLVNQPLAVAVIYTALYTPFSLFLIRTYILAIPQELEDAARIDGAGDWQVFLRVIVPLISPGLLTVALIVGLHSWNEFIISITFLQNRQSATVISRFFALAGTYSSDLPGMMATAVMIAAPVVLFFVLLQKRFIDGIASGAVKG